jgi:hypothetical protein
MSVKEAVKYYVSLATLAVAFVGICTCFVWLLYPYKTVEFYNVPFPVDKPSYRAEDSIRIYMDYERFTDKDCVAHYRFTDGITFPMKPFTIQKTPGKRKGWGIPPITVPSVLPPGKYYLDICYTYPMNPIRDIVVTARTVWFEVQP